MKKEKKLNKSKYLPKVIEGLGMFGRKEKQGSGEKKHSGEVHFLPFSSP